MYKEFLIELISILKERDYEKATRHVEMMKNTKDVGLMARAEYIMTVFDYIYSDNEEKKSFILGHCRNVLEMIEQLRDDSKKYELGYNLYDDFNMENIIKIANNINGGQNYGTA